MDDEESSPWLNIHEGIFSEFEHLKPQQRKELNRLYQNHFDEVGGEDSRLNVSERMVNAFSGDLLIGVVSALIAGFFGWAGLTVLLTSVVVLTVAFRLSQKQIIQRVGNTKEVTAEEHPIIYDVFREACWQVGVEPESVQFEVSKHEITSAGAIPEIRYIIVSNDTIEKLDDNELSSILQHELTHIKEGVQPLYARILPAVAGIATAMALFTVTNDFLVIGGASALVSVIANSIARYMRVSDEIAADKGVSPENGVPLATSLIRLGMGKAAHVESSAMLFIHSIIDPHPPVNKRLEYILQGDSDAEITVPDSIEPASWREIIRFPIGLIGITAVLIGYLSIVSPRVSPSVAVFGFALMISDPLFDRTSDSPRIVEVLTNIFGVLSIGLLLSVVGGVMEIVSRLIGYNFGSFVESAGVGVLIFFIAILSLKFGVTIVLFVVDTGEFNVNVPRNHPMVERRIRRDGQKTWLY